MSKCIVQPHIVIRTVGKAWGVHGASVMLWADRTWITQKNPHCPVGLGSGVGAVKVMKGYRNRMCKLLAWGGSLAPSWSRQEGRGTWADQGRERADPEQVGARRPSKDLAFIPHAQERHWWVSDGERPHADVQPEGCKDACKNIDWMAFFFLKYVYQAISTKCKESLPAFHLLIGRFFKNLFNWRLITLQYCSGFCHTMTWISHWLVDVFTWEHKVFKMTHLRNEVKIFR